MAKISPKMIYDKICETAIGQEDAKRAISLALYLHLVRYYVWVMKNVNVPKPTVLIHGPSGCGKTFILREGIKAVGQIMQNNKLMPLCEIDGSGITPRGFHGENAHDLIKNFYEEMQGVSATHDYWPSAIFFVDEIDKICGQGHRDGEWNREKQYTLLKLLEGSVLDVSNWGGRTPTTIDMNGPLFIFAGNFPTLRHNRLAQKKPGMGFSGPMKIEESFIQKELQKAGMVTQLVGRIQLFGEVTQLTEEELTKIAQGHILGNLNKMLKYVGVKIDSEHEIVQQAVKEAIENETGARGLHSSIVSALEDLLFEKEINLPFEAKFVEKK